MLARACFLVAMVSLAGCSLLKRDLPDTVYEADAWTVHLASGCGERATLVDTLRFTESSFRINRTDSTCLYIQAGRLFEEAEPSAHRVQVHGGPMSYVSVICDDDNSVDYAPTAGVNWTIMVGPGKDHCQIWTQPDRESTAGPGLDLSVNWTRVD